MGGGIVGSSPELSNLGGLRSIPHQQVENGGVQREIGALEDKGTSSLMGKERGSPHPRGRVDKRGGMTLLHTPPLAPGGWGGTQAAVPPPSPLDKSSSSAGHSGL